MTAHRILHNTRPMDHASRIEPMCPHDVAFARRNDPPFNPNRGMIRLFLLLVAMACLAPFVACVWPN